MNFLHKCPKCNNSRIAGPHRLHAHGHLSIDLPGSKTATLEALTCANCGYTEFYSDRKGLKNINEVGRFLAEGSELINNDFSSEKWCPTCGSIIFGKPQSCIECGASLN